MFPVTLEQPSVGGLTDNRQGEDTGKKTQCGDPVWEVCRQALIRARLLTVSSSCYWMLISSSRTQYWLVSLISSVGHPHPLLLSFSLPLLFCLFSFFVSDWTELAVTWLRMRGKLLAHHRKHVSVLLCWMLSWLSTYGVDSFALSIGPPAHGLLWVLAIIYSLSL